MEQMTNTAEQKLAEECADVMALHDAVSQSLGIKIESLAPGKAVLSMQVREDMLNGHGICHGGMIFTLADTAFAYACNSENQAAVASGCSIDFLRPGAKGERLIATAEKHYQSRRTGLYDVSVCNQDNEVLAQFRGRAFRINRTVISEENEL